MPINTMQANLGIPANQEEPLPLNTPSPAQAAQLMSQQAQQARQFSLQQLQSVSQLVGTTPAVSTMLYQMGNQQAVTQYLSPQPSPLQTYMQGGNYAQSPTAPSFNPVPLMPPPPLITTPFTPRPPSVPMYTTAWEQEMRNRELRQDSLSALGAQIPSALGQLGAYGGAAALGASVLGGRFGSIGKAVGAIGGMALADLSGVAQGMGNLAGLPFRDQRESLEMGGAIQRMTSNFVVAPGPQRNLFGPGLNQASSVQLGSDIQTMAQNPAFKASTGGMFNSSDLMNIMGQASQAGLMDQSQNVSAIRRNLQMTAQTIREFMQLTNDPDVSNIIRTMANLQHQAGMNQTQMREAAANMRAYARSAGTSIDAIQSMGGLQGAATFMQTGASAAAGYNYGMYALAAARQGVGMGGFSPSLLQQLGGVPGIAAREMQMQAAAISMEPLVMAVSQQGPQGFQFDSDTLSNMLGMPGAFGLKSMAKRAKEQFKGATANQLAMYPLQQQQIQEQLSESVSPQQATLMRYKMALDTGQEMGLTGAAAFVTGARRLFGDESMRQMVQQGGTSAYWQTQIQEIRLRENERRAQYWDTANRGKILPEDYMGFGTIINSGKEALAAVGKGIKDITTPDGGEYGFARAARTTYESAARAIGRGISAVGEYFDNNEEYRRYGIIRRKRDPQTTIRNEDELRMLQREGVRALRDVGGFTPKGGPLDIGGRTAMQMLMYTSEIADASGRATEDRQELQRASWGARNILSLNRFTWFASDQIVGAAETVGGIVAKSNMGTAGMQYRAQTMLEEYRKLQDVMEGGGAAYGTPEYEAQARSITKKTGATVEEQDRITSAIQSRIKSEVGRGEGPLSYGQLQNIYRQVVGASGVAEPVRKRMLESNDIQRQMLRTGVVTATQGEEDRKRIQEKYSDVQGPAEEIAKAFKEQQGIGPDALRDALSEARGRKKTTWGWIKYAANDFWYGSKADYGSGDFESLTEEEFSVAQDLASQHTPLRAAVMSAMLKPDTAAKDLDALKAEYKKGGGTDRGWIQVRDDATKAKAKLTTTEVDFLKQNSDTLKLYGTFQRIQATKVRENLDATLKDTIGQSVQFLDKGGQLVDFGQLATGAGEGKIGELLAEEVGSPKRAVGNLMSEYKSAVSYMEKQTRFTQASKGQQAEYRKRLSERYWGKLLGVGGVQPEEEVTQSGVGVPGTGKEERAAMQAQQQFTKILKDLTDPGGAFVEFGKSVTNFRESVEKFSRK